VVRVIPPLKVSHQIVKSRLIRELISRGDFNQAVNLLGHPYQIGGRVVKGRGTGRKIGFPTANLEIIPEKLIPARGVYAGRFGKYKCAVNIGGRPTFGEGKTLLETHILGFNDNIRGKIIKLKLVKRLREEKQFSDVSKLASQICRDINQVKEGG
jgi:riboflavin kinase/FMN adenylyltransferase